MSMNTSGYVEREITGLLDKALLSSYLSFDVMSLTESALPIIDTDV